MKLRYLKQSMYMRMKHKNISTIYLQKYIKSDAYLINYIKCSFCYFVDKGIVTRDQLNKYRSILNIYSTGTYYDISNDNIKYVFLINRCAAVKNKIIYAANCQLYLKNIINGILYKSEVTAFNSTLSLNNCKNVKLYRKSNVFLYSKSTAKAYDKTKVLRDDTSEVKLYGNSYLV